MLVVLALLATFVPVAHAEGMPDEEPEQSSGSEEPADEEPASGGDEEPDSEPEDELEEAPLIESTASVTTNKDDYFPGEFVAVSGEGWQSREVVSISVEADEKGPWTHEADITAASDGSFFYEFQIADWYVPSYTLTAAGPLSGEVTITFTDDDFPEGSHQNNHNGGGSNSLLIGVPSTAQAGDLLFAQVTFEKGSDVGSNTHITPSGWTLIRRDNRGTDIGQALFYRVATATEPASYTWSFQNGPKVAGGMIRYPGIHPTNPIVAHNGAVGDSNTFTAPSIASVAGSRLVSTFAFKKKDTTLSVPAGMTGRYNFQNPNDVTQRLADQLDPANPTGTRVSTPSPNNSDKWVAQNVTLRPAPVPTHELTVTKAGSGTGTVTSNPAGIDCGSDCSESYNQGTEVTLTATADPGSTFAGWSGACAGTGTCQVTMDAAKSVTATFNVAQQPTQTEADDAGAVYGDESVELSATVSSASAVNEGTVTFTVESGSTEICSAESGTVDGGAAEATCDIPAGTLVGDYSITAAYSGGPNFAASGDSATLTITPKTLTGSFTAADKAYDGTTAATITDRDLTGVIGTDDVSLSGGSASFADANVGSGKTVTGTGFALSGGDAGNYVLASSTLTTTASITAAEVTGHFTADDKEYDGTDAATISGRSLSGVPSDVDLELVGGTASFADKHVGEEKLVTGEGFTLSGDDAANYSLASTTLTTTAEITAKTVTGSFTAHDKVYDGSDEADIDERSLSGAVGGDDVDLAGGMATFEDANVGQNKTVTGTGFALSGGDAGNYVLASSTLTTTASITGLEVTGHFFADDKEYDGTTAATVSQTWLTGERSEDDVALAVTQAAFVNRNAGVGKSVEAIEFALVGAQAVNYSLSRVDPATADITQKALSGSFTAASKEYDGTRDATVAATSLLDPIQGDEVDLVVSDALFDTKDVGTDKDVTGNLSLSGADAINYSVNAVHTAKANITAKGLTGSFTVSDKEYDGTADAEITSREVQGKVDDDDVSLTGGTASFEDKNVGEDKTVTGTGFTLTGDHAGNYTLISVANTTASITAKALTGSFTAENKVYDGTRTATVADTDLPEVIGDDDVDLVVSSALFDTKDVGSDKDVTGALSLSGADAGNYTVNASHTTQASITPKSITGSFTAADKVYDGTTAATITGRSLQGAVEDDDVSLSGGTAAFADKHVGENKTVTGAGFTLAGDDAGNYTLTSVSPTSASITAAELTGSFTASDKEYDGTTAATVTGRSLNGQIGGDDVSLTGGTASFGDKNVGEDKTVTLTGYSLAGDDKDNYTLTSVSTTAASITPKALSGSFTASDKVYDGTRDATVATKSLPGVIGGDTVTLVVTSALFDTKDIGTDKDVTGALSLSGADAANYTVNASHTTKASITPKGLTVTGITADDKVWDGNTTATLNTAGAELVGVVNGDSVSLDTAGAVGAFASSNVGTWTVTISGLTISGGDSGNYTLTQPTTTASISAWNAQGYGFYQPVGVSNSVFVAAPDKAPAATSTTKWNTAKGGSTVPLKFNAYAGSQKLTDVTSDIRSFTQTKLSSCTTGAGTDQIADDLLTTGNTNLRYDLKDDQFVQNWKTPSVSSETCYRATVTFADGSSLSAFFKLRK